MTPSVEQIEKWAEDTGDGWVRIPASCWPELLWVLREAERAERVLTATQQFVSSAGRVITTVQGSAYDRLLRAWSVYASGREAGE